MIDSKTDKFDSIENLFGQILRKLRIEKGISQEDLGFKSGYHRTYISLLERGQKNPSLQTIFRLSKALEISPSEIIRRIENINRKSL
jgi:transcriptional regulator with XRE-family HTH domain